MKVPESIHLYGAQPGQNGVQDLTSPSSTNMPGSYSNSPQMSSGQMSNAQAEKIAQDVEQLMQDSGGGMPNMGMNGGNMGMNGGMPPPMSNMNGGMQNFMPNMGMNGGGSQFSMPNMGNVNTRGGANSFGAGGPPAGTPIPTASNPSSGSGMSGTTPVNLTIPGENKPVPLLMSQPDANGNKQLYATDGTHRGSINAQGKVTFDSENAANKVVNMNSDGHAGYDISGNGQGGYTLNSGTLTDGNLSS